ncbi:putative Ig domain-containing protein, partial [Hydrogenophaga sp. 5NK40-0174]|uniref:putative Ig domain-containing protein n=1 Tax=Hydrogenophaga sp. 5NK40-0174 TaxID=3127649 RepID=UPI00333F1BC0
DSDPDGDPLTVVPQTGAAGSAGGVFDVAANGDVTFDPNGDFESLAPGESVATTLTYTIDDGQGGTDTATITVIVNGENDAPQVVPGSEIPDQVDVDGNTIAPIDTSSAFTDPDSSDVLTFSAAGLPTGLTIDTNTGVISGTVDNSASQNAPGGVFTVTVTATDPAGATVTDTFTYTITNPVPVAQDNDYGVSEDAGAAVVGNALTDDTGDGVDSDPDGDTLTVQPQSNVAG